MITRLRIENFKAWRDTGSLRLAPLTVFFGENSSGKSSINHLLMMLKQTADSPDRNSIFMFGDSNSAVELGSFPEAIFEHDLRNDLKFGFEWQLGRPLSVRDPRSRRRYQGTRIEFAASASQSGPTRQVVSNGFTYKLKNEKGGDEISVEFVRDSKRSDRWRINTENYELVRKPGRAWELPRPVQFFGFPAQALIYYQNSEFLNSFELELERVLANLSYLGPLRSSPKRLYVWSGGIPQSVGWSGEYAIEAILSGTDRRYNWKPKSALRPLGAIVAKNLQEMGLVESFDVAPIAPNRDLYEVNIRTRGHGEVKLTDVGFGISQVLPVVVQTFYAPAGSTVIMEQPEIHLHPSVQASLADLFIAGISAREGAAARNVQLIVESHSEHFLRRLQLRVAQGKIAAEDVALYFCSSSPAGSKIEPLKLDSVGDIHNWPPNFFGDELADVAAQTRISVASRRNAT